MFIMRNYLNDMFPADTANENIGEKWENIDNNIFTNDFLYGIMND